MSRVEGNCAGKDAYALTWHVAATAVPKDTSCGSLCVDCAHRRPSLLRSPVAQTSPSCSWRVGAPSFALTSSTVSSLNFTTSTALPSPFIHVSSSFCGLAAWHGDTAQPSWWSSIPRL
eukprot:1372100-Pleurochrysis_carterae.AAC.2